MNILVLSCGTGGGHNAAARAVEAEARQRGHNVTMMNPIDLCGEKAAQLVDNAYISIAQRSPRSFGFVYALGNAYRRLPWRSPVYFANGKGAEALEGYLQEHPADVVITTHVYPGEMLTYLKNHGAAVPKTIFVATDYTCIPFTEECRLDAYVIPAPALTAEFVGWGIPEEKIYPFGIPVGRVFREAVSKAEAKRQLALAEGKRYVLVSGGSIGAGSLEKTMELLTDLTRGTDFHVIAICGSNASVRRQLEKRFGAEATLLGNTDKMALYLRACDLYLTKPGGLSTTEAAVANVPLVHILAFSGCETKNAEFFSQRGMSIRADNAQAAVEAAWSLIRSPERAEQMRQAQRRHINPYAARDIVARVTGDLGGAGQE